MVASCRIFVFVGRVITLATKCSLKSHIRAPRATEINCVLVGGSCELLGEGIIDHLHTTSGIPELVSHHNGAVPAIVKGCLLKWLHPCCHAPRVLLAAEQLTNAGQLEAGQQPTQGSWP